MIGKLVIFCALLIAAQGLRLKGESHELNQRIAHTSNYAWYSVEEAKSGACRNDTNCDGERVCFYRYCRGIARPVKNPAYRYDENVTEGKCPTSQADPYYAYREYYCSGSRTCSAAGRCENLPPKGPNYTYAERLTLSRCPIPSDPNYPIRDHFCDGARTCSQHGFCQGKAR